MHSDSIVPEVVIDADTVCSVVTYAVLHAVTNIALITVCLCYVVWELRLVKKRSSIFAGPLHQIFECVLDCQAIHRDVIARDNETCVAGIILVLHRADNVMVSTPEPDVVTNNMARRDAKHHIGLCLCLCRIVGSTYASEDVMQKAWVHLVALVGAISPLKECVSTEQTSLKQQTRDSYSIDIPHSHCWLSFRRNQGGKAKSEHNLVLLYHL